MNYSKIDICSIALLKLGANTITNFSDDTAESKISKTLYDITKEKLLSSYPWSFATDLINMSPLSETGKNDYSYTYLLPKNVLRVLSCGITPSYENISYKIIKDKIHTNTQNLSIKVIININEEDMPPFFVNLLCDSLACEYCLPLTEDNAKAGYLKEFYLSQERIAKLIDSQQKTPQKITKFSLIDCRN